ncbi:MAG: homoserine acetyltransferase, partial [Candidatus Omnitrophota bacterium]
LEIESNYGHDVFLVEIDGQSKLIKHYLNKIAYT